MLASLVAGLAGYAADTSAMESAAVLRQPQGRVFVSQGSAMTLAQEGMPLYAGNRVIAVSGGRAEIAYAEGCVVALPENSLLAVKGSEQCRLGQAQVRATGGFQNARIGQAPPAPSGGTDSAIADLKRLQGSVLLNEAPAWNNQNAHRDDQVVTEKQSKVAVMFRACEVDMGPGEQATVNELRERCKSGVFLASGEDPNAEIAIIKRPQGSVLVDKGAARTDMGVKSGNRIITGTGSRVTVVFKGCEVILDESEKAKVGELVTKCKGGLWTDAGAPVGAGIAGAGAGAGIGIGTGAIVVGGGLGAILIGAIVADRGGNEPPASPQ
ncbi:MAG: hypothetical protein P9F19_14320 [Candidatus Contendobacter sp.]|nr:hypothetical protein [Candidatus Contendobacter sp.]MDG4558548.1 hypothetical protein [Candidatus Contendobacter sp.]